MEKKYRVNEADLESVVKTLSESEIKVLKKEEAMNSDSSFLLLPIEKGHIVLLTLSEEADDLFASMNKKREKYLDKCEVAEGYFKKGNLKALLSTLFIILAIGVGFFAVGLGMKQSVGYYALLVLAVLILALSIYLIKLGTADYALGRERKRNAKELLK